MKLQSRSFLSLKTPIIIGIIAFWNAGFFTAMALGDGFPYAAFTPLGKTIVVIVLFSLFIFSLSIALVEPLQAMLIEPKRQHHFRSLEFYFLAAVSGLMAFTFLFIPV